MKTDILNAPKSIDIHPAISLDGFIVKETLAKEALADMRKKPAEKKVFTPADLWNIRRRSKIGRGVRF